MPLKIRVTLSIWIMAFVLVGLMAVFGPVKAHDWYSGLSNPGSKVSCCGGNDCFAIKLLELDRLTENGTHYILDGKWYFLKSEAMPAMHIEDGDSGYSACIWGGKPRCFFFPSGS
jgi:hypothetical protein